MFRTTASTLFKHNSISGVGSVMKPGASRAAGSFKNLCPPMEQPSLGTAFNTLSHDSESKGANRYHTMNRVVSSIQVSSNTAKSATIKSSLSYDNLGSSTKSTISSKQNKSYSISAKKRSKSRFLHQDLISLGVHLGHDKKFESIAARPYILGYRHDFSIFDVRHTMWSMKRSLNFLRQASFRNCRSLFFHSGLYKMDPAFKVFFMHLAQKEKQMLIDSKWQPGIFTNFHHSCHGLLKQFAREYVRSNAMRRMTMLELFMRVLHFTQSQYLDVVGWRQHQKNMSKFWRFFCFFKTYQYLNSVPDVVVLLNPGNQYTILQELKRFHIPIVGVVDSNSFYSGISYPIWGNDDSPMFALFLFQLYMNAYKLGRYDRYKLLMDKSPRGLFDEKKGRPDVLLPLNYVQRKKHAQMKDKATGRARIN